MPLRFAPSTSGLAHPGTLLAGMLAWLDARALAPQEKFVLRLEDIDHERCKPEYADDMVEALRWLWLDWDKLQHQHLHRAMHEGALDLLEAKGRLFACGCSRSEIKSHARRAADGGWRYPGTCRHRLTIGQGWRSFIAKGDAIRLKLDPDETIELSDEFANESGLGLTQNPYLAMGDPILVSKSRALSYHIAVVVDDGVGAITRIVRGHDLAASTGIHVVLQRLLGFRTPAYQHHFLLLEPSGEKNLEEPGKAPASAATIRPKFSKLHGAVDWHALRDHLSPDRLVCFLAGVAGLLTEPDGSRGSGWQPRASECEPIDLADLRERFSWQRVRQADAPLFWTGSDLVLHER